MKTPLLLSIFFAKTARPFPLMRQAWQHLQRFISLNSGGWGRGDEPAKPTADPALPQEPPKPVVPPPPPPPPPKPPKKGDEPPDLEEVWRELNKKVNALFGNKPKRASSSDLAPKPGIDRNASPDGPNQAPPTPQGQGGAPFGGKAAGALMALGLAALTVLWLGTGFYIVQEGQVAVISQFGKYQSTSGAGLHWRLPYPVQADEKVDVSRVRRVEIGTKASSGPQRLKEALMLTDDENIVDIQFEVQYRIKEGGAAGYVYSNKAPEEAVKQAAESAMREEVGRRSIDEVLNKGRQEVANAVEKRIQNILDRYKVRRTDVEKEEYFDSGILITAVAIQNAQPPEQVQSAFDDAVKAVQDKERQISEGQAYANDVVPRAKGAASRLMSESEGYKQRVVQTAEGDAARFKSIVTEYAKAPAVTRQRMYLDTMQKVFESTSKVLVDTKGSGNMLYLPLDKIIAQTASESAKATDTAVNTAPVNGAAPPLAKDNGLRPRDLRDAR